MSGVRLVVPRQRERVAAAKALPPLQRLEQCGRKVAVGAVPVRSRVLHHFHIAVKGAPHVRVHVHLPLLARGTVRAGHAVAHNVTHENLGGEPLGPERDRPQRRLDAGRVRGDGGELSRVGPSVVSLNPSPAAFAPPAAFPS